MSTEMVRPFVGFEGEENFLFWEALHHWYNKSFYQPNSDLQAFSKPTVLIHQTGYLANTGYYVRM
jgi:hypothetical protein